MPCAANLPGRVSPWRRPAGNPPSRSFGSRPVLRRRPNSRRGLRLRLFRAEPDVPGRRHLQQLPRAAWPSIESTRQRCLRPVPPASGLRQHHASPPRRQLSRSKVRELPHARHDLHVGGPSSRPQPADPTTGSQCHRRHAQRLQRLPRGPDGRMGHGRPAEMGYPLRGCRVTPGRDPAARPPG